MASLTISQLPATSSLSLVDRFPIDTNIGGVINTKSATIAQILALTTFPTASTSIIGGVRVGSGLSIDVNGVLSVVGSAYTLPIASSTTLGGIKIGANLTIDINGVLSAQAGGSSALATTTTPGTVQIGTGINVSGGVISVAYGSTANTSVQGNDTRVVNAAPLASPALTGVPTAPTAVINTNTTQLATTAYVVGQGYVTLAAIPTATASTLGLVKPDGTTLVNSTGVISVSYGTLANTACQGNDSRLSGNAPLASPVFTGTPAAPTPLTTDNSTTIATTAFVVSKIAAVSSGVTQVLGNSGAVTLAQLVTGGVAAIASNQTFSGNNTFSGTNTFSGIATFSAIPVLPSGIVNYAPLASPTFTGTVVVPTVTPGSDNTTKAASTAFVQSAISAISAGVTSVLGNSGAVTLAQLVTGGVAPLASPTFTGTPTVPGYLTTTLAASTYATKANSIYSGTQNFTGATLTAATPTTTDNSTLVATTAYVQANFNNSVTGTLLSGNGTPGVVYTDSAGNASIQNSYRFTAHNIVTPVTGRNYVEIVPTNMILTGVTVGCINVTGSANGFTAIVSINGTNVPGLTACAATGTSGYTNFVATNPMSVTAGGGIAFQIVVNGTFPSNGTAFVQLYGTWG